MRKLFLLLIVPIVFSCQSIDNRIQKLVKSATGSCFKISLFSGGKAVKTYYTNYVSSEEQTDGWFFKDNRGKFIRLSGNISIEEVPNSFCNSQNN